MKKRRRKRKPVRFKAIHRGTVMPHGMEPSYGITACAFLSRASCGIVCAKIS